MMDAGLVIAADATLIRDWDPIADLLAGYIAILVIPGPNMLSIGALAALRGFRATLPVCVGIALGAGSLGALLLCSLSFASGNTAVWLDFGRAIGALLLLCAAAAVARRRPAGESDADTKCRASGVALFSAGFCTAATNPVTAAFFASRFLGPLAGGFVALRFMAMVLAIVATALVFSIGIAAALAFPAAQRAAIKHHRKVQITAIATLLIMAAATIKPLLILTLGVY